MGGGEFADKVRAFDLFEDVADEGAAHEVQTAYVADRNLLELACFRVKNCDAACDTALAEDFLDGVVVLFLVDGGQKAFAFDLG